MHIQQTENNFKKDSTNLGAFSFSSPFFANGINISFPMREGSEEDGWADKNRAFRETMAIFVPN